MTEAAMPAAMPEVTKYAPGSFSWMDLLTSHVAAAKQFYGELFGWTYDDIPMGNGASYTMANLAGKPVAGLMQNDQPGMPPFWQSYITVENGDATTARVADAGGSVLQPALDVFDSGRMSIIQDPSGGVVSLWEPRNHIGSGYAAGPGVPSWHELWTHDVATAANFFNKLLGWKTEMAVGEDGYAYASCNNGDAPVAVIWMLRPEMSETPPHWAVYFGSADVAADAAKAQALGATLINGPTEAAGFPFALLQDPQGAMFFILGAPA